MSLFLKKISYNKTKHIFDFYYIEYDYISLSPDQYNFFLKKNLFHILPNVNVFSRRNSFAFIVEAGPEIYRSNKIYKHIYKKDYLFLDRLVLRDGYSSLLCILL